jgi:hypothetical protein
MEWPFSTDSKHHPLTKPVGVNSARGLGVVRPIFLDMVRFLVISRLSPASESQGFGQYSSSSVRVRRMRDVRSVEPFRARSHRLPAHGIGQHTHKASQTRCAISGALRMNLNIRLYLRRVSTECRQVITAILDSTALH